MNKKALFEKEFFNGTSLDEVRKRQNPQYITDSKELEIESGFSINDVKQGLRLA